MKKKSTRKRIYIGAGVLVGIAFIAIFVAQWYSTPAGVRWVATGAAERSDTDSGTLFLDKRIAPIVREHYVSRIEDWGAIVKSKLQLTPKRLPSLYFFYDRATFEKYSKESDSSIRAFYASQTHSVYTHGSFEVGGQTTNLDEEGTLVHELTHAVIHSSLGEIPVWLDEGLAHFIENGTLHQGKWYPGIPAGGQVSEVFDALEADQLPPLARLCQAGRSEFAEMGRLSRGLSVFVIMFMGEGGHLKDFLKGLSAMHDRQNPDEITRLLSESCGIPKDDLQAAFVQFLRNKPEIEAYGNAVRFTAAGRHSDAIKFYRKAIECDPSRGLFWDRLGLSLFYSPGDGSEGEGAMAYQKAAAADPYRGQLTALTIVGNQLFNSGQYEAARQAYQRVMERTLPTPTILHHLAITYADEAPEQALKFVDDALALPRDGVFYQEMFEKLEELRRELIANITGDETR